MHVWPLEVNIWPIRRLLTSIHSNSGACYQLWGNHYLMNDATSYHHSDQFASMLFARAFLRNYNTQVNAPRLPMTTDVATSKSVVNSHRVQSTYGCVTLEIRFDSFKVVYQRYITESNPIEFSKPHNECRLNSMRLDNRIWCSNIRFNANRCTLSSVKLNLFRFNSNWCEWNNLICSGFHPGSGEFPRVRN